MGGNKSEKFPIVETNSFQLVSKAVSTCPACHAVVNPRWRQCLSCGHEWHESASSVVSGHTQPAPKVEDAQDSFEERAAIIEYDGEVPQEWAAGLAHLCVMPCPEGVDVIRWRQVVDNAGRFADEWAVKASTLGWDTADIFGVDRHKPEAAIHTAGLIWLLGDKRIVAISADAVIVETPNGARQSFRPSVGDNDSSRRVLLWEMAD